MTASIASQITHQIVHATASVASSAFHAIASQPANSTTRAASQTFRIASADWPAWVQAVGSILAILVAIGVAAWQTSESRALLREQEEQARRDAKEAERAKYGKFVALAKTLTKRICQAKVLVMQPEPNIEHLGRVLRNQETVSLALQALQDVRYLELPSAQAINALQQLQSLAPPMSRRLTALADDFRFSTKIDEFFDERNEKKKALVLDLQSIGEKFREFALALGINESEFSDAEWTWR
ncbi:hypothetical protein SAMN02745857_00448 [Andreprevotia lacus DSM 23236]|jgi:hypothetical protein|uniref:Transmembrane protein n=1 Tax=Andreprevotia lacus DSM 23236 TaxID=1121001 RepID=A0A1W1X2M0_9NEIS|nr:hypothetical protein [Andreprevotia lacus]SMC18010.1 hypothetical protein SAMN02745857_00448 [Andreprevotia lacus DSM 23236]